MRLLTPILLLLLAIDASAAVRRLDTDCTLPGSPPSEAQPFDLDPARSAEATTLPELLKDIRHKWPSGFYVRAPSKTVTVISDYIAWPSTTKVYVFMEDQDPANKLTVQHGPTRPTIWRMWKFENFTTVKLGGPNLSITFRGNHPGLANCDAQYPYAIAAGIPDATAKICDINRGLIEFRMSDGTQATLADVRANVKFAQQYRDLHLGLGVLRGSVRDREQDPATELWRACTTRHPASSSTTAYETHGRIPIGPSSATRTCGCLVGTARCRVPSRADCRWVAAIRPRIRCECPPSPATTWTRSRAA